VTASWLVRAALVGALALVLFAVLALMRRAWRRKAVRQRDIPVPREAPTVSIEWVTEPLAGRYLSSTRAGDWLDRIVVHSMGVPSRAVMGVVTDGVWIERQGERDVFVPRESLVEARLDRGIAGKVYEQGGIVVVMWRLGDMVIDTGFRAQNPDHHAELVTAVNACRVETSSPSLSTPGAEPGATPGGLQ